MTIIEAIKARLWKGEEIGLYFGVKGLMREAKEIIEMAGYKTYVGAAALFAGAFFFWWTGDTQQAVRVFGEAMVAIGIAHKLQRMIVATNGNTIVTAAASDGIPQVPQTAAVEVVRSINAGNEAPSAPGPSDH